jgi:hypothetical protein
MNHSLVPRLIRKDLQMKWPSLVLAIVTGCGALALFYFGSSGLSIAGIIAFFVVLIMLGIMPMGLIMNERKKQTLAFVMSLPVSARQYGLAKIAASLGMFVVPWLMLVSFAFSLILSRSDIPNGIIPFAFVLMLLPLIGFLLMTSVAIVSESEMSSIVTMGAVNISYSFVWLTITMTPGLTRDAGSAVPVWNSTILSALGMEVGAILTILALTLYLQSRKRDFI